MAPVDGDSFSRAAARDVSGRAPVELFVPRLSPTRRLVTLAPVVLRRSTDGGPPRQETKVRVATRDGALLVRFDGRDEAVVATRIGRDEPLWEEDVFEVFLEPPGAAGVYYEFEVNPLGALFDARIESPEGRRETMHADVGWNCPGYSARVRRRPGRWSAVLRIPLAPMGDAAGRWRETSTGSIAERVTNTRRGARRSPIRPTSTSRRGSDC